jgi:uncharacterized protein (TIGR02246 family)
MRYMLFICGGGDGDGRGAMPIEDWVEEMTAKRRVRLDGHRLTEPRDAATVRVRGGETLVTDGPFAETKEFIAGYDIIECGSLQEAVDVAAKHPMAAAGSVEVRAYWEDEDPEGAIARLEADITAAIHDRDADRLVAHYTDDIVMYDAMGGHTTGVAGARATQADFFATLTGPVTREVSDTDLHIGEGVAFGSAVNRISGATTDGGRMDFRMRVTTGYRQYGDGWRIAHQHVSGPIGGPDQEA